MSDSSIGGHLQRELQFPTWSLPCTQFQWRFQVEHPWRTPLTFFSEFEVAIIATDDQQSLPMVLYVRQSLPATWSFLKIEAGDLGMLRQRSWIFAGSGDIAHHLAFLWLVLCWLRPISVRGLCLGGRQAPLLQEARASLLLLAGGFLVSAFKITDRPSYTAHKSACPSCTLPRLYTIGSEEWEGQLPEVSGTTVAGVSVP